MKSIIASLFTIYQLTTVVNSNRLLLQGNGVGAPPQFIQATEAAVGLPTEAAVALPTEATLPPQATTTAWVSIPLPTPPTNVIGSVMECVLDNTNQAGCAGRANILLDPPMNMVTDCSARGACATTVFNFTYTSYSGGAARRVKSMVFSEEYAGYNTKIICDTTLSGGAESIDEIACTTKNACFGMSVKLIGGCSLSNVKCGNALAEYCVGATVEDCEWYPCTYDTTLLAAEMTYTTCAVGQRRFLVCKPTDPMTGY